MRPLSPSASLPTMARRRAFPASWSLATRVLGALATLAGAALLIPIERVGGRLGRGAPALAAIAAIGRAATSFAFLLISEHTPLFGFQEPGYDPAGIAAARISEIATVVLLAAFFAAYTTQRRSSS